MIQPLPAGLRVNDRYTITKVIASGGMGVVYLAFDERDECNVAVKQTFFNDETLRKAFDREAALLARLDHPNIPRVTDRFEANGSPCLVMTFVTGRDLGQLFSEKIAADGRPFPLERVLGWADSLLDTLAHLHALSPPVIHRDIKPTNLKETRDGRLLLLDFGLAKGHATQSSQPASVSAHTPGYAPLEQMQGTGTDARSDLYAVGATLYQLLSGTTPASAMTRGICVLSGQPDPLRPIGEIVPNLPVQVARTIDSALSLAAAGRPQSATAMRQALQVQIGLAPTAPAVLPDTRPAAVPVRVTDIVSELERERDQRRGGGRKIAVAAVVVLAVLVVGALLVGGGYYAYTQFGQPVVSSGAVNPEAVRGVATRMEFVAIPAGEFSMGVPKDEPGQTDPDTPHQVTLTKPFEMGKFEVTQEQWQSVMGANPSTFSGCADCPVEQVNWNDCQDFLKRLNDYSDLYVYRLPTEAEWEYACRGGTTESAPSPIGDFAWIRENSIQSTHPVGKKKPNAFGLYDMYGNVWEWCQDYFGEYPKEEVKDPKGPTEGKYRIFRGGGWSSESMDCKAWKRLPSEPDDRKLILGFRVVRERR